MALNVNGADQTTSGTVSISDTDTIRLAVDYSGYESAVVSTSPSGVLTVTKITEGSNSDIYSIVVDATGTATLTITFTDENNEVTTETITFDAVKGAEPSVEPSGVWTDVHVVPVMSSRPWINLDPSNSVAQSKGVEGLYGMPLSDDYLKDYEVEFVPVVAQGATPEAIASVQVTSSNENRVIVQSTLGTSSNTNNKVAVLRCVGHAAGWVTLTFTITTESGATFTKELVVDTMALSDYITLSGGNYNNSNIYIASAYDGTVSAVIAKREVTFDSSTVVLAGPQISFEEPAAGWNNEEENTAVTESVDGTTGAITLTITADTTTESNCTRYLFIRTSANYVIPSMSAIPVRFKYVAPE